MCKAIKEKVNDTESMCVQAALMAVQEHEASRRWAGESRVQRTKMSPKGRDHVQVTLASQQLQKAVCLTQTQQM